MTVSNEISAKQRFSMVMSTCSILSAILVVWIHAYNVDVYSDSNRVIYWFQEVVSQGVARGAVPFFLMSSAFFLYSKEKTVLTVYRLRSQSVLVPYLLWNTIYMVAFTVLRRLSLSQTGMDTITVGDVAQGVFLQKYNYSYWFMRDLIVLIVLYPVIRWVLSRGKVASIIGLVLLCVTVWGCGVAVIKSGFYYYIGAVLGYHYRDIGERVQQMGKKKQSGIIFSLLILGSVLFVVWYSHKVLWIMMLRDLIMAFLMFFVVVRCNIRIGSAFAALSFMIYSIHPLLLEIIEKIIYLYCPHNDLWMMIDYIVAPVICVLLIVGICFLWKKVLPKVYRLLNGGRM